MAINTRDRRASAGGIGPLPLSFPLPDGLALSEGDQEQLTALYRGNPPTVAAASNSHMRPWRVQYPDP